MKAEIISVGTELLMGQIVNTDAQYIAHQLPALGIDVFFQTTVGDNASRLKGCILQAMERSDIIFLTGGLGPTLDDITKHTLAEALGLPMRLDEASAAHLEAYFQNLNRLMTPNNLRQAEFPEGAKILPNRRGTAPGCIVTQKDKHFIVLPGPPVELEDMFTQQVIRYLQSLTSEQIVSRTLRIFGIGESEVEHRLRDLIDRQSNPTIAPYAGFGEVTLRLTVKCGRDDPAQALLDPLDIQIRERLGNQHVYGVGDLPLPGVVAQMLIQGGYTLALAESCTGGMLASELVAYPGISACLLEGIVAYSNEAKVRLLGVREETLAQYGAVSPQAALEMARGVFQRSGAQIALSTTGIAGPDGGSEHKPVGLMYIGLVSETGEETFTLRLSGDRQRVRRMGALLALYRLYLYLDNIQIK